MSKRRGFTLTEIVVVIALTSLVLAMVGGCLYFVSTYSGTLISKSEELTKVQTIETYLRGQVRLVQDGKYITNYSELQEFLINDEGNIVKNNSTEPIIKNTGFKEIKFVFISEDGEEVDISSNTGKFFLQCQLFKNNGEMAYSFILGIVQK